MEQRLPELQQLIAAASASPGATASLTDAERRQLAQNRQIVAFYADSEDMPQYACFGNSYRLPADSIYE